MTIEEIWSDAHKYVLWLKCEVAALHGWNSVGLIPHADIEYMKYNGVFDMARYEELYDQTKHDMIAFVQCVQESMDVRGRWFHYGLTSSDIVDTAFSLQIRESLDLCMVESAKWTGMLSMRIHDLLSSAKNAISVGMFSGPVGTHATVPPEVEEKACEMLGLEPDPITNQIISRDRHAYVMSMLAIACATLSREMKGHLGYEARIVIGDCMTAMQNIALWHERDISHSSTERIIFPRAFRTLMQMIEGYRARVDAAVLTAGQ